MKKELRKSTANHATNTYFGMSAMSGCGCTNYCGDNDFYPQEGKVREFHTMSNLG